jgi:hypothetical protein
VRRVVLCLLILAVLLPSAVFARTGLLCRFDGQLRAACCCPDRDKQATPSTPSLRAACCCTRLTAAAPSRDPAAHEVSRAPAPALVAIVETPLPAIVPAVRVMLAPRTVAPPDPDHSLFSRHCALLL